MDLQQRKLQGGGDWTWFTEFAGVTMSSNYYTFHLMSVVMRENWQIAGIMELGTYWGTMAIHLGLLGMRYGIPVTTFDIEDLLEPGTKKILDALRVQRNVGDIFEPTRQTQIKEMMGSFPIYLIIDNGNKAKEFKEFVPMLKSGSVVSVHDYGTEFFDADWEVHKDKVEPYLQDEWQAHNVQFASFKVR
jgi:predicted O-methyltransferase YrrM